MVSISLQAIALLTHKVTHGTQYLRIQKSLWKGNPLSNILWSWETNLTRKFHELENQVGESLDINGNDIFPNFHSMFSSSVSRDVWWVKSAGTERGTCLQTFYHKNETQKVLLDVKRFSENISNIQRMIIRASIVTSSNWSLFYGGFPTAFPQH